MSRSSWTLVWAVSLTILLAWPPPSGRSLGLKLLNWAVDPRQALPTFPEPLPIGLDDDGNAVAAHDELERSYYDFYNRSRFTRWRMEMKEAGEPFDAGTTRQALIGLGVVGALLAWRLNARAV